MSVQIGSHGERVIVRFDGGWGHSLHWQAAKDLALELEEPGSEAVRQVRIGLALYDVPAGYAPRVAKALYCKALEAEQWAKRERIADDGALLCRVGFPVGLTDHPAIKEEIKQRAAWDGALRRYLPGGVKSAQVVGAPTIWAAPKTARTEGNGKHRSK